jgi:precorrin-6B methylase 2
MRRIADRVFGDLARRGDLDNLYNQITAYIQLHELVGSSPVLYPLRGWALSPDAIVYILADLELRDDPVIVEFGSGESTLILASALRRKNAGRLITIEHDESFMRELGARLKAAQLARWVSLHHAPRMQPEDPGDCELNLSALARGRPLQWALKHLKPNGTIFLDDANRPAEQSLLAKLMDEQNDVHCQMIHTEKGLAKLTFVQA